MARIRTIKPEFWEDEVIATLTRDARLLFVACFNMADDEGLLRWSPAFIKSNAFMYDDDITVEAAEQLMLELTNAEIVFPYVAGQARQKLAFIVQFRRHQKINRPQLSKLPPPSIQNGDVRRMYERRDGGKCHLCGGDISHEAGDNKRCLSLDHLTAKVNGGTDYPSNIAAAHKCCNSGRRERDVDTFTPPPNSYDDPSKWREHSVNGAVNDSVSASPQGAEPFTGGREGKGKGREGEGLRASAPSKTCPRHQNDPNPPACRGCATARESFTRWDLEQKTGVRSAVRACGLCDSDGRRWDPAGKHRGTVGPCDHRPLAAVS